MPHLDRFCLALVLFFALGESACARDFWSNPSSSYGQSISRAQSLKAPNPSLIGGSGSSLYRGSSSVSFASRGLVSSRGSAQNTSMPIKEHRSTSSSRGSAQPASPSRPTAYTPPSDETLAKASPATGKPNANAAAGFAFTTPHISPIPADGSDENSVLATKSTEELPPIYPLQDAVR